MRVGPVSIALVLLTLTGMAVAIHKQSSESTRLVTGKFITPSGDQIEVGSFPVNMKLSPDGRFIAVTNCGFREQLSIIDAKSGQLLTRKQFITSRRSPSGLYFGLAFFQPASGPLKLYASRGAEDLITEFEVSASGDLKQIRDISDAGPKDPSGLPRHVAGVTVSPDGQTLYAVNNQTHAFNGMRGSVSAIDLSTGAIKTYPVGGYPMDVALAPHVGAQGKLYVSSERDGTIAGIDLATGTTDTIRTGFSTVSLTLNRDGSRLYASNPGSDTESVIETANDRVTDTILLRAGDLASLPGASPLGQSLSNDEQTLYVAMADFNAVAVVDLRRNRLTGFIPAGWGPTSLAVTQDGQKLFVANAKGVQTRNPNDKPVRNWDQYAPNILEGTVSVIDLPNAVKLLDASTRVVMANNMAVGDVEKQNQKAFVNPGIDHVVYIIKENRTYDQILGDDERGNGDKSICLFPKEVTPNQHALADRFVLLDNFYVCAEVSFDGWAWSTQGIANPYLERNVPYNYSDRGRTYDSEGTNSEVPVDLRGVRDVSTEPNGYIWDQCARQGVSYRNYGFFLTDGDKRLDPSTGKPISEANAPARRALVNHTDTDFLHFDTAYADSEAWVKYALNPAPKQLASYGAHNDPSRVSVWLREFDNYVKNNDLPRFSMLRLMRDHTAGTSPGQSSPRAMVADNDYAVGQVVDAVSHSKYWKRTIICVLEDDAQAGFDHVDCHRSTAYLISPWIEKGKVDSHFYNTDSMLRTMELILGLKPLNQYDAIASPINVCSRTESNAKEYEAILPPKNIVAEVNEENAYRAMDSQRLIARFNEDSAPDIELNDILWGDIKGAKTPRPALHGAQWKAIDPD